MSIDENRPYPEGIAWDEAWRQRQRADKAEAARDKLADIVRRLATYSNERQLFVLIEDAEKLWSEMQREAKGGGDE